MTIEFNRTNHTPGLSKPGTTGVRQNPAQLSPQQTDKQADINQSTQQVRTGEQVQLSKDARQLQRLTDKIAAQPEVNTDKVAQLKQAIAEGSYKIDNQRVADKLLGLEAQF